LLFSRHWDDLVGVLSVEGCMEGMEGRLCRGGKWLKKGRGAGLGERVIGAGFRRQTFHNRGTRLSDSAGRASAHARSIRKTHMMHSCATKVSAVQIVREVVA
jgi:hypothetical protein